LGTFDFDYCECFSIGAVQYLLPNPSSHSSFNRHSPPYRTSTMKLVALLSAAAILGTTTTATAFITPKPSVAVTSTTTALDATIAVFGASGLTAQECIYQALKDGDKVVGLTRNPSKLVIPKGSGGVDADKPLVDSNLTVIAGDVTNPVDVAKGTIFLTNRISNMPTHF
jgi:hypothetical protein